MLYSASSQGHDIVVAAASAGGVEALMGFVAELPGRLQAAVFVLLHVLETGPTMLPQILGRRCRLPVSLAIDGQAIRAGHVYVAAPGRHLALEPGRVRLIAGPRENGHRPSADVLFRTAAHVYGPRVLGIVLSGADDDGAAGLAAIKRAGGLAAAQDPTEALHSRMPRSAVQAVAVDHCLPVHEIAHVVADLAPAQSSLHEERRVEEAVQAADGPLRMQEMEGPYQDLAPTVCTCPECHGTLWELDEGDVVRFRCRVGHAYTAEHLLSGQAHNVESALWMALRTLEERAQLSRGMSSRAKKHGLHRAAARFDETTSEARRAADTLRALLLDAESGVMAGETTASAEDEGPIHAP